MIYFNCYQCDKPDYLFKDSRCAVCTMVDLDDELPQDDRIGNNPELKELMQS